MIATELGMVYLTRKHMTKQRYLQTVTTMNYGLMTKIMRMSYHGMRNKEMYFGDQLLRLERRTIQRLYLPFYPGTT